MKLVIQKRDIENVLVRSIPFLENKDNSMVTSNVCISLEDGVATVYATNYELGLKCTIDTLGIVENGSVIVNGKKLIDIIKILKNDNITIEAKSKDLHISQSRSKFKIALFTDGEYPLFPNMDSNLDVKIDSAVMINAFREITPCIDTNNPKYEFNGALLDIKKDGINFVSTDIKRLSIVSVPNASDNDYSIIIPRLAILEIQKLFLDDVKIYCNDVYLVIESKNLLFFTKLINGKFPEYKRIIPTELKHQIKIDKMLMIESIKQIMTVSTEIKIDICNNKMVFSSVNDANNEAKTDIEISFEYSESITLVFNSKFVLDFLNVIYDNAFVFGINDENMPFILQSGDLKTIIMPIVL